MATFSIEFRESEAFGIAFSDDGAFSADFGVVISSTPYQGEYEFTPSGETQTVNTAGYALAQDIIINPIPPNYGKITWNGSVITVS